MLRKGCDEAFVSVHRTRPSHVSCVKGILLLLVLEVYEYRTLYPVPVVSVKCQRTKVVEEGAASAFFSAAMLTE